MKYFCVSDVHSYYEQLIEALNNSGFDIDNEEHVLCVLGDLFDRGPSSVELLKFAQRLNDLGRLIYIRGNHEDLLFQATQEIVSGRIPDNHHFSNGTIDTIAQFCDETSYDFRIYRSMSDNERVKDVMLPILDWINNTAVNYAEIGDCILVHGWVPCICDDLNIYHSRKNVKLAPRDWWDSDGNYDCTDVWEEARWLNGMNCWKQGAVIDGETIICGHWHCSYGWSHIRQKRPEFPQKNQKDWLKSFEPFIDDGIAAIDSCVAYTGKINVLTLEA